MKSRSVNVAAPFQKIQAAARITGLSTYMLRHGCKDGSIPHVKSGTTFYVNVPRLLEQLDAGPVGTGVQLRERDERGSGIEGAR